MRAMYRVSSSSQSLRPDGAERGQALGVRKLVPHIERDEGTGCFLSGASAIKPVMAPGFLPVQQVGVVSNYAAVVRRGNCPPTIATNYI